MYKYKYFKQNYQDAKYKFKVQFHSIFAII